MKSTYLNLVILFHLASSYNLLARGFPSISNGQDTTVTPRTLTFNFDRMDRLTDDHKAVLATAANRAKEVSDTFLELVSSGKTKADVKKAKEVSEKIKQHLIQKEGIPKKRIQIKIVEYAPEFEKTVVFKYYKTKKIRRS